MESRDRRLGNQDAGQRARGAKAIVLGLFHPGRKFVGKLALAASRLTEMAIVAKIDDFFAAQLSEADELKPSADSGDEVEY